VPPMRAAEPRAGGSLLACGTFEVSPCLDACPVPAGTAQGTLLEESGLERAHPCGDDR
jgi:hypothetical protein